MSVLLHLTSAQTVKGQMGEKDWALALKINEYHPRDRTNELEAG